MKKQKILTLMIATLISSTALASDKYSVSASSEVIDDYMMCQILLKSAPVLLSKSAPL